MSTTIPAAIAAELRRTVPFRSLPVTTRPQDALWHAQNDTLLALRLPLHHAFLNKRRPKPKDYETAIQMGLALLASGAKILGTRQIIVCLEDGMRQSVSFQPRPFGDANWTAAHAISPPILHSNFTDPLLDPADTRPTSLELTTRGLLHLAGQTAMAWRNHIPDTSLDGMVTFLFDSHLSNDVPNAHMVWRPSPPNLPTCTVRLVI